MMDIDNLQFNLDELSAEEFELLELEGAVYVPGINSGLVLFEENTKSGSKSFFHNPFYDREGQIAYLNELCKTPKDNSQVTRCILVENSDSKICRTLHFSPMMMAMYLREYDIARKLFCMGYSIEENDLENVFFEWKYVIVSEGNYSKASIQFLQNQEDINGSNDVTLGEFDKLHRIKCTSKRVSAINIVITDRNFPEDLASKVDSEYVVDIENVQTVDTMDIVDVYMFSMQFVFQSADWNKHKKKMMPYSRLFEICSIFCNSIYVTDESLKKPIIIYLLLNNNYRVDEDLYHKNLFLLWNDLLYEQFLIVKQNNESLEEFIYAIGESYAAPDNVTTDANKINVNELDAIHVFVYDDNLMDKEILECIDILKKTKYRILKGIKDPFLKNIYRWIILNSLVDDIWCAVMNNDFIDRERFINELAKIYEPLLKDITPDYDELLLGILYSEANRYNCDYRFNNYCIVAYKLIDIYYSAVKRKICFSNCSDSYFFLYSFFRSVDLKSFSDMEDEYFEISKIYEKIDFNNTDIKLSEENDRNIYSCLLSKILSLRDFSLFSDFVDRNLIKKSSLGICRDVAIEKGWYSLIPYIFAMS